MSKKADDSGEAQDARSRYDDALLCANWNPVIDLLQDSSRKRASRSSRRELSEEEAKAFLGRIYASGA